MVRNNILSLKRKFPLIIVSCIIFLIILFINNIKDLYLIQINEAFLQKYYLIKQMESKTLFCFNRKHTM